MAELWLVQTFAPVIIKPSVRLYWAKDGPELGHFKIIIKNSKKVPVKDHVFACLKVFIDKHHLERIILILIRNSFVVSCNAGVQPLGLQNQSKISVQIFECKCI